MASISFREWRDYCRAIAAHMKIFYFRVILF